MAEIHSSKPPKSVDVLVIGGGITGCAAAYYLSRMGVTVAVVERKEVASGQSSRACGFVRQQGRHPHETAFAHLGNQLWKDLNTELGMKGGFVAGGMLTIAETSDDLDRMRRAHNAVSDSQISTHHVSQADIARLIPSLRGEWRGGLFTPEDGQAEPEEVTYAFARAAERHGAIICTQTTAKSFEGRNGRVHLVNTTAGTIRADVVLIAAGMGSPHLLRMLACDLPILSVRSSVAETEPIDRITDATVWAPKFSFRQTRSGSIHICNGYRGPAGDFDVCLDALRFGWKFLPILRTKHKCLNIRISPLFSKFFNHGVAPEFHDPCPNNYTIEHNARHFVLAFPHTRDIRIIRRWAGEVDITPDKLPIIDRLPSFSNVIIATGLSGHGFALGPALGLVLSKMIAGERPPIDVHPFRLGRFRDGEARFFAEGL